MKTDFAAIVKDLNDLIEEIKVHIKNKSILESASRLDKANVLLDAIKTMGSGETQARIVTNRELQLQSFAKQIEAIFSKREAGKKQDGNIALKCNWNDKHYQAPCSRQAYNYNIAEGRAWCKAPVNKCREYSDNVSVDDHPCYESIALKEMYFGAGWDHTGERNQPRHIQSAKEGRMAILTTRPPGTEEQDRLIIGCLFIGNIQEDPDKETIIFGDRSKCITVDYDNIKVKFWDYYKNAGAENLILWASGLFRYVTDETVLNVLMGIGEQYKNAGRDGSLIIELVKYYEELIAKKNKKKK